MWQKFGEEEERRSGITMSEVFSPMLTPTPLEATISECSLDLKPSDVFTPKLRRRCLQCFSVILLMLIPIIGFMLFLEWRRVTILLENPELLIVNGSFHLANSACGPVQGIAIERGFEFRGIPYAIPPTDDLYSSSYNKSSNYKWKPATSPFRHEHCWRDILPYPKLKPNECLQIRNVTNEKYDIVGNEDCLTLDIYTPLIGYDTPSPVVVVIAVPTLFGGWTDQTHADFAMPNAALAKEKGVVFVVPRFRLGPLGFLPRLLLNDTSSIVQNSTNFEEAIIQIQKLQLELEKSYNLGLTDLTAALIWVNTNIEHFGGDASVVTLLGWGAGAHLVSTLTSLRPPKGYPFLFTQAWVTENPLLPVKFDEKSESWNTTKPNYEAGYELWKNSPCNKNQSKYDPLCLIGLGPRKLFESVPIDWLKDDAYRWLQPDNFVYRESAESTWSRNDPPNDFPFAIGASSHGALGYASSCESIQTEINASYASLRKMAPELVVEVESYYSNLTDMYSKSSVLSDLRVTCPSMRLARTADKAFNSGVFFYVASYEETRQCSNGLSLRLADNLADLKAILGRYSTKDTVSSQTASQLQNAFYYFVIEGALPGRQKRAKQGVYLFTNQTQTLTDYPQCSKLLG